MLGCRAPRFERDSGGGRHAHLVGQLQQQPALIGVELAEAVEQPLLASRQRGRGRFVDAYPGERQNVVGVYPMILQHGGDAPC